MYGTAHGTTVTKTITLKARCQTPTFSFNNTNNQVTITTGTGGATIYYTTDGSEPTTSSTLYSGPFAQSTAATIKAIAVKAGSANSEVGEFNVVKLATPDMEFDAAGTTATFSSSDEGVTFHYNSYDVDDGASDPGNPITNGTTWNGSSVVTFSINDLCKLATTKTATATTGYINSDVFLRRANNTNMTNRNFVFFYDDGVDVHFMANQGGTVSNTTTFNPSTCIWEGEFFANADASLAEIGLYYEPFVRYKNNGKYLKIYNGGPDFEHTGYESGKLRLTNSLGDSMYFFP
ncbi:MAG: chitobiase/beta-hexosaminidase C-terminal domain-containing protein, partial [Bacteroidales bacterium]|nr:chitobiase/beta-hexosaminidase C-terminal domain-containing protein [Bacteroidales bacterium]